MTSREGAPTQQMNPIKEIMERIKVAESGGDYQAQVSFVNSDGVTDRRVGAYGIVLSKWVDLAESVGLAGANWRDPAAQDAVVSARVVRDINSFRSTIGDTLSDAEYADLAITSFKFGKDLADQVASVDINGVESLAPVSEYLKRSEGATDLAVGTTVPVGERATARSGVTTKTSKDTNLSRAESSVRDVIRSMLPSTEKSPGQLTPDIQPQDTNTEV